MHHKIVANRIVDGTQVSEIANFMKVLEVFAYLMLTVLVQRKVQISRRTEIRTSKKSGSPVRSGVDHSNPTDQMTGWGGGGQWGGAKSIAGVLRWL